MLKVTCYGPRGSLPAPSRKGFSTVEYGGNTSCYYVEAGPFRIILDNGSGCAVLGNDLMKDVLLPQVKATGKMGKGFINLISHFHWDHIQGLPFCVPYFIGGNVFHIHGPTPSGFEDSTLLRTSVETQLADQQKNPHFPVAHECLPARKVYLGHARQFSEVFWYIKQALSDFYVLSKEDPTKGIMPPNPENVIKITTIPLNHPDGCLGYRLDYMGSSFTYCTDNEPLRHTNAQINKHAKGTDMILLDGQYAESQLSTGTQTFGHGTPLACVEQAVACEAKHVLIHHHDPNHDDVKVGAMENAVCHMTTDTLKKIEFCREGTVWMIGQ